MAAYILTTPDGRRYWAGPGLLPLTALGRQGGRLPLWDDRTSACAAAEALHRALGLPRLVPTLVRVPRR